MPAEVHQKRPTFLKMATLPTNLKMHNRCSRKRCPIDEVKRGGEEERPQATAIRKRLIREREKSTTALNLHPFERGTARKATHAERFE
jgi:hypothetical protein